MLLYSILLLLGIVLILISSTRTWEKWSSEDTTIILTVLFNFIGVALIVIGSKAITIQKTLRAYEEGRFKKEYTIIDKDTVNYRYVYIE